MNTLLSSIAGRITSYWNPQTSKARPFKQSDSLHLATTQLVTNNLNQMISDRLPGCSLLKATLEETKDGKLSLLTGSRETIIFSDEKTLNQWLGNKQMVDIWQIKDLREGKSDTFYKLQRKNNWGYDTFETKEKLFDQLREDYGVFWKLENQGENQTSYIQFKTGLFNNRYVEVEHENLSFVANNLKLKGANLPTSTTQSSEQTSWGKGIAACVLGGLLLSAGKSWGQSSSENPVSDALAMMKGTIGPAAFKAAFAFQMAAMSRQEGGILPTALLAGMMFLPVSVRGQPFCPQIVGNYSTPGLAYGVTVSGNYAYVAEDDLQIIDVSNVSNPTLAGFYNTADQAYGVALSGNYAFVADGWGGLLIIDVSNVNNSSLAGSHSMPGYAYGITVSGNYAYVADSGSGLQIIDVSNVANPTFAGSYDTPVNARGIALSGNYAYVADDSSGLQIIDVSNVANPTLAGSYDTPGTAWAVALSGNYAYVADSGSGLQIIDVSNVANPTLAGFYDTPDTTYGVAISGNYAYVADGLSGLQIIDVSNVANPTLAGSYNTPDIAQEVAVLGNYAYVADTTGGLQIIDLACPTSSTSSPSSSPTSSITPTTNSNPPTTTTSTTESTSSTLSLTSTTPSTPTTNNPTRTSSTNALTSSLSSSEPSTTQPTTTADILNTTSNTTPLPFLWIGLIGGGALGGGALLICMVGGAVCILQRRKKHPHRETRHIQSDLPTTSRNFELEPVKKKSHTEIGEEYFQLSQIKKDEAEQIYEQTGHLIVFPKGQTSIEHIIGQGHFGAIKVAQRIEDGKYVASKKVKGEENMRASEEEANMQREAAGDNILPIYNTINFSSAIYHFMPLAGYGNAREIQDQLSLSNDPKLVTRIIKFVAEDILIGLETIHEKNIYHLDIKPENIVFTKDGTGYITDFGCAKKARAKHKQLSYKANGDNRYFSPERLQASKGKNSFDPEKADVWATGIMLLQMLKNVSPLELFDLPQDFDARVELCTPDYFQEKINQFQELQKPKEGSIWSLIKNLLAPEEIRLTAEQALEGAYFSGRSNLSKASMFKELRKEMLIQETGISRDKFKDNYKNISDSMPPEGMKRKGFYQSEDHRKHYHVRFGGGGGL